MSFAMPAEWSDHAGCLMAWPSRPDLWEGVLEVAQNEYAAVAQAVAQFEPVTMIAAPGQAGAAQAACGPDVSVIEFEIDDAWFRDSGPIFVTDADGTLAGVDFRFNAWGSKHSPWSADDAVSGRLLAELGIDRIHSELILEGGAITVDGEGTLITTEQCLLNPNRNPGRSRDEIELELKDKLGVSVIIWLPYGGLLDTETDGHVDGVCVFAGPGRVVLHVPADPTHPDYQRMRDNLEVLRSARDAAGRPLEIIQLSQSNQVLLGDREIEVSYLNFYIANGGVIVPVADHPSDAAALDTIAQAFPDRKVVGVPARAIAWGGGGAHCITQQMPAGSR